MVNKVILVGYVGLDPEVRTLETGVKVARVRLATSERIFNRQTNETTEHTEWHTVTLWRGLAEVVDKYVRKGSQLYIEGSIRSREWERDGVKHYATEIVADEMKLLGRRSEGVQQAGYQQPTCQTPQQPSYQAPQQPVYQAPQAPQAPQPAYQPEPQPEAPFIPQDNGADDLPF